MYRFVFPLIGVLSCTVTVSAEDTKLIAGRPMDAYLSQLDDDDRVVRLRAIRSLGAFGATAGNALREALDHEDAAVRYVAAVQLGNIGGESLEQSTKRLGTLASDPASLAVRMAASYAMCRSGDVEKHLPLLIEALEHPERGMSCSAAELIGAVGSNAAAAIEALQAVYEKHRPGVKGGDYHRGGAAMNALRKVRSE